MAEKEKSFVDRLWDFFASVKLAIVLFSLIALTSIIGTVIEQNASPEKNIIVLKRLVGENLAPTVYRILDILGFMDMYHSWWFVTLLVLFAMNLIICSLERLPRIWNLIKEPVKPLNPERIPAFPIRKEIVIRHSPETVREALVQSVKQLGFKPMNSPLEDGGYQLYAQKGNWSRLGVYITHLSIIMIMIGAVIGIFFGFNGFLNLPEGYTSDVAYSRKDSKPHPLGFSIRCDDFDVEFYGMSDMPKDYRSWLTVFKDGKEVMKKMIEVNSPLKFEGYTFYQSSYGMLSTGRGFFIFKVKGPGGKTETITKIMGESFIIPGTNIKGTIKKFSPALAISQDGKTYTYAQMMNNPAVYIEFTENGKPKYSGWILKRYPQTWRLPDGSIVQFIDYWGVQYTGLQVRKDPGVWIVYLGCVVMAIGLYMAFFMSHKRIWLIASKAKEGTLIRILATANKNRAGFERKVETLVSNLNREV